MTMFFQIDFGDNLPIYDQVVRQIKFAIAGGILKDSELVPSVRELARELTINPNTVARAYRRLQDEGILTSVRGTGLAVAPAARDRCRQERIELIRSRLEQVFAEARQSRIDPGELRDLVEQQLREQTSAPAKETKRTGN
jgi:GntR family transcriptional regulator